MKNVKGRAYVASSNVLQHIAQIQKKEETSGESSCCNGVRVALWTLNFFGLQRVGDLDKGLSAS